MMSPYGPAEKQAMLEAPDLKTRAEILIAVTEMDLAKKAHQRRHRVAERRAAKRELHSGRGVVSRDR